MGGRGTTKGFFGHGATAKGTELEHVRTSGLRPASAAAEDKLERQGESEDERRRLFLGGLGSSGPRGIRDVARLHDGCVGFLLQVSGVRLRLELGSCRGVG